MKHIVRTFQDTGAEFTLSPEHWLALDTASQLEGKVRLGDLVEFVSRTKKPPSDARFVLDTGNAREGLLDITILGDPASGRTSAKKVAQDGDVIVSRLRPYLRQVTFIPGGTCELLGVDELFCSTEFYVLRPRERGRSIAGLVAWLLSNPVQDMLAAATTGGHHPRVGAELLAEAKVHDQYLAARLSQEIEEVLRAHINGQRKLFSILRY